MYYNIILLKMANKNKTKAYVKISYNTYRYIIMKWKVFSNFFPEIVIQNETKNVLNSRIITEMVIPIISFL